MKLAVMKQINMKQFVKRFSSRLLISVFLFAFLVSPVAANDRISALEQEIASQYGITVKTIHPEHTVASSEYDILTYTSSEEAERSLEILKRELPRIQPFWQNRFELELIVGSTPAGSNYLGLASMWWNRYSPLVRCEIQLGDGGVVNGERLPSILFHELMHCYNKYDQYRLVETYRSQFTMSEYVTAVWGQESNADILVDYANEEVSEYFGYIMTGMDYGLQSRPRYANPQHEAKLAFVQDAYQSVMVQPYVVKQPAVIIDQVVVYTSRTWSDGKVVQLDYYNRSEQKVRELLINYSDMTFQIRDLVSGSTDVFPLQ